MPTSMLEIIATADLPVSFSSPQDISAIEGLAAAGYVRIRVPSNTAIPGIEVTELTKIGRQIASQFVPDSTRMQLPLERRNRRLQALKLVAVSVGALALSIAVTRF